ncbi:hypothetical protein Q7P37_009034 [Cladosporium fusiforme]
MFTLTLTLALNVSRSRQQSIAAPTAVLSSALHHTIIPPLPVSDKCHGCPSTMDSTSETNQKPSAIEAEMVRAAHATRPKRRDSEQLAGPESDSQACAPPKRRRLRNEMSLVEETLKVVWPATCARLTTELQEEHKWNAQVETRVKQDMFLRIMHEQELRAKAEYNLERERRVHKKAIAELKGAVEKADAAARQAQANNLRAVGQQGTLRLEIEHLQDVTTTLEADLDDLRNIENEDAVKRSNENRGLPPAYGSLNDEDRFPPYSRHADAGTLEVAHIKHTALETFDKQVDVILEGADRAKIFIHLTRSLAFACQRFQALLDAAPSITVSRRNRRKKRSEVPTTLPYHAISRSGDEARQSSSAVFKAREGSKAPQTAAPRHTNQRQHLVQKRASAPYVADRITRLIHELTWRMTMLTSALQLAFRDNRPLPKLKLYLTQTMALRTHLLQVQPGYGYKYYDKAISWLEEQVECQRALLGGLPYKRNTDDESDDEDARASSRYQSEYEPSDEDNHCDSEDGDGEET